VTALEAFTELVARLSIKAGAPVTIGEDERGEWPPDAVLAMQRQGLLAKAAPAISMVCDGCEEQCVMPVHIQAGSKPFIVCDKLQDVNRIAVAPKRLRQWRCDVAALRIFVAESLALRLADEARPAAGVWAIGMMSGHKRSQMICLKLESNAELFAGDRSAALADLVRFEAGKFTLNAEEVRRLVDASSTADSRYTPSVVRREAHKLDTQALHENWRKEYRALKQRRPGMTDRWYSLQISKLKIAEEHSAETIRKNMKS
jgi:hypothetical protein